ncbi:MAG: radical SAM protein [Desulfamplus sp.]|nr:radical SAM protein [Desulfamplus sp.]
MLGRTLRTILHISSPMPTSVQVDVTTVCNFKCRMCPIHFVKQEHKHIDFELFKRIVDNLHGVDEIALVGLGEPFTNPNIFEAIKYCKNKGMCVRTTTNGSLLHTEKRIRDLFDSGLDSLSFSVDALKEGLSHQDGHDSPHVLQNIEAILTERNKRGGEGPQLTIQSVLQLHREQDIYDIIAWGAERGIDRFNVLRMHMYFDNNIKRHDEQGEKIVHAELARLRRKYGVRIDCLQDQFFTGFQGFLYKHTKHLLRLDSFCIRLLDYPLINQEGDVVPCCALPRKTFGNVLENKLADIWHGTSITHFRKTHQDHPICSKCDNWRIRQII